MEMSQAVAIVGIWLSVAVIGLKHEEAAVFISFFALLATVAVAVNK